jgi:hypothetical protein
VIKPPGGWRATLDLFLLIPGAHIGREHPSAGEVAFRDEVVELGPTVDDAARLQVAEAKESASNPRSCDLQDENRRTLVEVSPI